MTLFAQRQDHGARCPHPVFGQRGQIGVLDLVNAGDRQIVMVDIEWQALVHALWRHGLLLQLAVGDRIGERVVERDQDDLAFSQILGRIDRQPGSLGVIAFGRVRIGPGVAPAGIDLDHVTGQDAAPPEALSGQHGLDIGFGHQGAGRQRLAFAHMALGIEQNRGCDDRRDIFNAQFEER